jgi:hypothetical protein
MDIVRRARFSSAFTFQYSPRPGTPAAEMEAQVPKEVVQDRFERLVALQDEIMLEDNRALVGTEVELLVQASGGRKNEKTNRLSGRARDGRLVHFSPRGDLDGEIRPGDVVTTTITAAKPYFLIADGGVSQHRRTKAGDMSSAGKTPSTAPVGVSLGLPTVSTRSN